MEMQDLFMKKEAKNGVRQHGRAFDAEVNRLENEIEQEAARAAVEDGNSGRMRSTGRQSRRVRRTRGDMVYKKNRGYCGDDNVTTLHQQIDRKFRMTGGAVGKEEKEVSEWDRIEDERRVEFERSMKDLTRGPRVKAKERIRVPLSFNEEKKPRFMMKKGDEDYEEGKRR